MAAAIFVCDVSGAEEARARLPARSKRAGSAFSLSLLALAAERVWGFSQLPEICDEGGRPVFRDAPQRYFSLSNTRGFVLAALSDCPIGADVQAHRALGLGHVEKLASERERRDFEFFELWSLRESFFKLTGEGSLRSLRFYREAGEIIPPREGVLCRLYDELPACSCAACSTGPLPERLQWVQAKEILRPD